MSSNKKYWKSVEELNENSSIVETLKQNEFVETAILQAFPDHFYQKSPHP